MPRPGTLLAIVALAAVVAAAPAVAGPPPPTTMKVSKHKNGPFKDAILKDHMSIGEARDYWYRVTNSTGSPQEVTLVSFSESTKKYKKTWFKGDKNITDDVYGTAADGYAFTVGQEAKLFRGHVKRKAGGGGATCMGADLYQGMTFLRFEAVTINGDNGCL